MAGLASAAEIAAPNLGFERWSAEGKLEDWLYKTPPEYTVARDCPPGSSTGCALRIERKPGPGPEFIPISQVMPLGKAAGHRVVLSGYIRTEDVRSGWAGLWLRVDGDRRPNLVLDNMSKTGPRGTTARQRFEIGVPAAPNASRLAFGVLLVGPGAAWFEDLKLSYDESVVVERDPRADVPTVAAPTRPQPSQALLTDAGLRLAPEDAPRVRDDWSHDIGGRVKPIRSLVSDDHSDLRFLKDVLKDKRVVQLGESGHGVAEFNWIKVRLVKYLHQELGFDVIAFESSLSGCDVADRRVGIDSPLEVMRQCIFGVWHTEETIELFEYLDRVRKAGKPLTLAGFDVQNSGAARPQVGARLAAYAEEVEEGLGKEITRVEARFVQGLSPEEARVLVDRYKRLADGVARKRDHLVANGKRPGEIELVIQEARSRIRFARQMSSPSVDSTAIRDEGMADNLDFLLDKVFPGRKVIVWAHNFHIAKESAPGRPRAMGTWVAERRGAETYTIGLFMGRGVAAHNNRELYAISSPPDASLEALIASARWTTTFLDLSATREQAEAWASQPMLARSWGINSETIVPNRTYDGVIYIDTVTPPRYR